MHRIRNHLIAAFLGAVIGATLGALCWLLYGLAYSLQWRGPGMDPVLRHWLIGMSGGFAVLGLLFGDRVLEWLSETISAIVHFEFQQAPRNPGFFMGLVLLALLACGLWWSAPGS